MSDLTPELTPEQRKKILDDRAQANESHNKQQIEYQLQEFGAPERQRRQREVIRSGPWGETEKKIIDRLKSGFLIALVGGRGCGKTQMAVEVMRASVGMKRSCLFASAMQFFMAIKATYRKESDDTEDQVLRRFSKVRLLILDEIGQRSENEWENRLLYELLNRRYNSLDDTLLISNQEIAQVESALGPSLISRMRETGGIIECAWETFRK